MSKLSFKKSTVEDETEVQELEVWIKTISCRTRIDICARILENVEDDLESYVYRTLVEDTKSFLASKNIVCSDFLPIAEYFKIVKVNSFEEESSIEVSKKEEPSKIFLLENLRHKGFKEDILHDREGLDYEHSVLAVSSLATFHAATFCYIREENISMIEKYPVLVEEVEVPDIQEDTVSMLEDIFKANPVYERFSDIFLDSVRGKTRSLNQNVEYFGVLCHGNFWRENLLFRYRSELESRYCSSEIIFQDLSSCHYGSAVIDLLQFIFTSVDIDVRHNFMADLVCSVYHDNFVKAVASINKNIPVFDMKSFIREFDRNIMYGFLFSFNIHCKIYEDAVEKAAVGEDNLSYRKFEESILSIIKDILQFKMSIRASKI